MIRQDRLEEQLLAAIKHRILQKGAIEATIKQYAQELKRRVSEMERKGEIATIASLNRDLEDRKRRQRKIMEAIETAGNIGTLAERLRDLQHEINQIQDAIAACQPINLETSMADLRSLVTHAIRALKESLANAPEDDLLRAKKGLCDHIGRLILTPIIRNGRPVYRVSGGVTVARPNDANRRMQVVARDGIEPPTPAFSGLRSTS